MSNINFSSRLTVGLALVLASVVRPQVVHAQRADSVSAEQTFYAYQVDQQAKVRTAPAPEYPYGLRQSRTPGEVLVQFVVDEHGRAQMTSFTVIRSTNEQFTQSVRHTVSAMMFYPAEVGGRKVKQLVQQPFKFSNN